MYDKIEGALDPVRDKGTEASAESSGRLVRDALETAGLDTFTSMLDAVEEFLTHLQLFDPNVAFGRAAFALNDAAAAFDSIDGNSDKRLSQQELARYAGRFEGNDKQYFEWILAHYDSIEKAFTDGADGISKKDLEYAASFFTGLEFVFANFDKLANSEDASGEHAKDGDASTEGVNGDAAIERGASGERVTLSHTDLERFLRQSDRELDAQQRKGLIQLTLLLRKLEGKSGRAGLTDQELREIDPETIWNEG